MKNPNLALYLVAALTVGGSAVAQEMPNDEPDSTDTLMERTDMGNTAQTALMSFTAGKRELDRARKLRTKAAETTDQGKREKYEKSSQEAYQSAIQQLTDAVQTDPKRVEAYSALGRAFLETGAAPQALQVFNAALQRAPNEAENQEGRAEALLGIGQLRDAAMSYESLRKSDPKMAARLLGVMKAWVSSHRQDPAGVPPEAVEALASIIDGWEKG